MPVLIAVCVVLVVAVLVVRHGKRALQREAYIRGYVLPRGLFAKLQARHPGFGTKDCELVAQGLRQFFLAYLKGGRRYVSMPSQAVDDLWHEFILYTRNYDAFCRQAFGGFLHHTPAVVLSADRQGNAGLRRCWWHACKAENINPRSPSRLPLLFALDAKLGIANGFHYVPDCGNVRRQGQKDGQGAVHCGGDFSSTSFDGGTAGFGDSGGAGDAAGATGDSSGGDSGCGGGGCGGGGGD